MRKFTNSEIGHTSQSDATTIFINFYTQISDDTNGAMKPTNAIRIGHEITKMRTSRNYSIPNATIAS